MVTTREAAPAVRLNADWQVKYRQRAHQFLLLADPHLHGKHQAEQSAGDDKLHVKKTHLHHQQQNAVASDGELHLEKLQQVAIAGDGELHQKIESVSGDIEIHLDQQQQDALSVNDDLLSVCIVGRSGVGKGSLINHLLQERAARVSRFEADLEENTFDYHDLFCIREIPGYDGWHSVDSTSRRERLFRHFHHSSHGG